MSGSLKRIVTALGFWIALFAWPSGGWGQSASFPAGSPSCPGVSAADRLENVTPEGDLVLAAGGLAKLAGIRLPEAPQRRDQALAWLRARTGLPLIVHGPEQRDRWNRLSGRITHKGESAWLDLAHGLVESGLAVVDPGVSDTFCQPELLALEETARERHLGVWADDGYNPIHAEHLAHLRERVGSFVLVEGRIRSVGERSQRTYLNFGEHWTDDFTIIIPRRTWTLMAGRGLSAAALKGQRIRARGILQSWQGTALTILVPDMIERLEGTRRPR
jgi:hypothetical protein